MSAWPERRRPSAVAALVDRAASWLLAPPGTRDAERAPPPRRPRLRLAAVPSEADPPEPGPSKPVRSEPGPPKPVAPPPDPPRPVVVVLGLAPRAGASTVARALAARLARVDPAGAAILFTADPPRAPISATAAARLARAATDAGVESARPAGRLCVLPASEPVAPLSARRPAPVVVDPGHGVPAGGAVALADHVVLVCPPDVEPALAVAVVASLRGAGHCVSLVVTRVLGDPAGDLAGALAIPESRIAAQLTLACREPRGALGTAVAELAERSLAEVRG